MPPFSLSRRDRLYLLYAAVLIALGSVCLWSFLSTDFTYHRPLDEADGGPAQGDR